MNDTPTATAARREEMIAGLRELADALEQNPGMAISEGGHEINIYVGSYAQQKGEGTEAPWETEVETMARLAKAVPGKLEKRPSEQFFSLRRTFGPIHYDLFASRAAVCTRVQVGTVTQKQTEIVEEREIDVEVPVYEWDCDPILGKAAAS